MAYDRHDSAPLRAGTYGGDKAGTGDGGYGCGNRTVEEHSSEKALIVGNLKVQTPKGHEIDIRTSNPSAVS